MSAAPNESHQVLRVDRSVAGWTRLRLARPQARNALSRALLLELRRELELLGRDTFDTSLLTLEGEGSVFCAGADLKERRGMSDAEVIGFLDDFRELNARLESLPITTVACVQGAAMGGGLELALACDQIFALKGVKLALPEVSLAILPGAGGTRRLVTRGVPLGVRRRLVQLGLPLDAAAALRAGLCDAVFEGSTELEAALSELHAHTQSLSPAAVSAAKRAVNALPSEAELDEERALYQSRLADPGRLEALKAFAARRSSR